MRYANIRELKLETNRVLEQCERYGNVIVTRKGRPVALIRAVAEDDVLIKARPLWNRLKDGAARAGFGPKDTGSLIKSARKKKK